ncbi:thioredoxin family protein [Novosphingobium sp.]|uniref:thioredoxin family protein n=1 Tax=Novosphingobium sp. TaxID=1874826 RepID=UPI00286E95B3|nr:thioredoxin family protein [Novosphingobium sp.]
MNLPAFLLALAALAPLGPGQSTDAFPVETPAAATTNYYPASEDADFALESAIAEARVSGRYAVIVFGADWCHDSRTLAEVLKSDEFTARFGKRFVVTFIDVGEPKIGKGRNLAIVEGLGLRNLRSTPALFALSGKGQRLNTAKDARSWRNADSRGKAVIMAWFDTFLAGQKL